MISKILIVWLYISLTSNFMIFSAERENLKTLVLLAPMAASNFAKNPTHLYDFVDENPAFAELPYTKCVLEGFQAHPKLKRQFYLHKPATSPRTYFDAMHIQFKCLRPVVDAVKD